MEKDGRRIKAEEGGGRKRRTRETTRQITRVGPRRWAAANFEGLGAKGGAQTENEGTGVPGGCACVSGVWGVTSSGQRLRGKGHKCVSVHTLTKNHRCRIMQQLRRKRCGRSTIFHHIQL